MSKEITEIINILCDKLGTSAKVLIPEIARANIAQNIVGMIICMIMFLYLISLCEKAVKYDIETFNDILLTTLFVSIPTIVVAIFLFGYISDLVGWVASPTARAIYEIVRMVK